MVNLIRDIGGDGRSAKQVLIDAGLLAEGATDEEFLALLQQPVNEAGDTVLAAITAAGLAVTGAGGTIDTREDTAIAAVAAQQSTSVAAVEASAGPAVAAEVSVSATGPSGDLYVAIQAGIADVAAEGATQVAAVEAAGDTILTPATGTLAVAEAAATAAVEAEGDAQVARVAATPASGMYQTKAAGDAAALATGAHFIVPGATGDGFTVYRVTGAGTSVEVNVLADQSAVEAAVAQAGRDLLSALPPNPVAVWPYSLYDATYKAIPNIVRPDVPLEQNLVLPTSRLFGSAAGGAVFWTKTNATCVDDAATGPSGVTDASSLSGTAGWKMMLASSSGQYFPAGQYTLGVYAKRNTGTDQDFAFTADNATTRSVKTATSTWQWFTYTVTIGAAKFGSQFGLCDSTGSNPAELLISDFVIYAGASAPEPQEKVGHAYFGKSLIKTSIPTAVDITGGVMTAFPGVAFFEEGFTAGAYTAVAVIERTADSHNVNPFLGRLQGTTTWGPGTPRGTPSTGGPVHPAGLPNFSNHIPGASLGTTQTRKMFELINEGPHFVWWRSDGTNTEYGVDDVSMGFDKNTWTARVVRDLWINGYTTTAISQHKASAYSALWDRCLTNAEIEQAYFAAKTEAIRSASINLTGDRLNRIIAFEGDSISSLTTTGYNSLYCDTTTKPFFGSMWAVGGSTLASMISRADYVDAMLPTNKYGRKFILTWMIGANDLMSPTFLTDYPGDVAEYITTLRAWSLARANAGWIVVPITTLPKSDANASTATTYNTRRTTLNADIIANLSAYGATTYVPFGEHPQMGDANSYTLYPTMWTDRTHPSNLGHSTYLEPTFRTVVDGL